MLPFAHGQLPNSPVSKEPARGISHLSGNSAAGPDGFSLYSAEKHVAQFNPLPMHLSGSVIQNQQFIPFAARFKESSSC